MFIWLIIEESLGRNLEVETEAGTPPPQKKMLLSGLLSYLAYAAQVRFLRDGISQSQLGPPSSISN